MRNFKKPQVCVFDSETTEVVLRKKVNRGGIRAPFSAIGPLTNIKYERKAMQPDVFDVLNQVSKGAFGVFCELKYRRDIRLNIAHYPMNDDLTRTQKETLSRKLKELRDVDLIRQVKGKVKVKERSLRFPRGTFMINPNLIRCTEHDESEALWNQCPKEINDAAVAPLSEED